MAAPNGARSSTGQSIGLRIRGLGVQIPPGAPMKSRGFGQSRQLRLIVDHQVDHYRSKYQLQFRSPPMSSIMNRRQTLEQK